MQPFRTLVWSLCTAGTLAGSLNNVSADTKANPYLSIVDRNPFGLKDPPPPAAPEPEKPAVPPAKVILTGITSLFGPTSKRCFLEITEQEPGKQANVKRPILREGESDAGVEVVSIDVEKNLVRIKNGGQELDLKFEDPAKLASAAPRPVVPGALPAPAPAYVPPPQASVGGPTIVSPESAEHSTRNSSVSMFGGQTAAPAPVANQMNMAGVNPALGAPMGGNPMMASRTLRSSQQSTETIVPEQQYLKMMVNSEAKQQTGRPVPPLPPIPDRSAYQGRDVPMPPSPGGFPPLPQ